MDKNVKAILFDLGNVLFDLDVQKTWRGIEALLGVEYDHPFNYPPTKEIMYAYEKGEIDTGVFVGEIQRLSKPGTTAEAVANAWNAMLVEVPKARFAFLERLKAKYPLYLLSNINSLHLEYFYRHIRNDHGIINWDNHFFEKTFYSNWLGMRKPENEIYKFVASEIGLPNDQILFVDDNEFNINAAAKLGIQTYHLGIKEEVIEIDIFKNI